MCYGSGIEFVNVQDFSAVESLDSYLDDHEVNTRWDPIELDADVPRHRCHVPHRRVATRPSDSAGERQAPSARIRSDGGSESAMVARRPALETDLDRLVEHAAFVVDQTGVLGDEDGVPNSRRTNGNQPRWGISEGDRVLLVVNPIYDDVVLQAAVTAIRNKGATIDTVHLNDGEAPRRIHPWYDEFPGVTFPEDPMDERIADLDAAKTPDERFGRGSTVSLWPWAPYPDRDRTEIEWWQDAAERYDVLIHGLGGPVQQRSYRYERFPWREVDNLAGNAPTFPRDVWTLIDTKTAALVERAEEMHLTDPEGTDLTWTNYVAYSRYAPCHTFAHPLLPTAEADTRGVVKGTINHVTPFPSIEVEIEAGKVVAVDGGGEFGELWRETLEVMREYDGVYGDMWDDAFTAWRNRNDLDDYDTYTGEYDYYDGSPGLFWLWEAAIGTNPKALRPTGRPLETNMFPLSARLRAGVMHLGMGTANGMLGVEREAADRGLPWGHVHVHLFFPTLEATMPDGRTERIIENGYLTTLDHPDVRDLASRHGDPDEILSIDWVPPVPGISVDGNYDEYAEDPLRWMNTHYA